MRAFYIRRAGSEKIQYVLLLPIDHLFVGTHHSAILVSLDDLEIDTLASIWGNANWLEREVFDMYGVKFTGHPDLRRLFMYDGFEGYPLRKDYPLRKRQPIIPMRYEDAD